MGSDIFVRTDNRLRLITSILALTGYSEMEQRIESHELHPIFLETIKWLEPFKEYEAITSMRDILNSGVQPSPFFHYVLSLSWPDFSSTRTVSSKYIGEDYKLRLKEFSEATRITELWKKQEPAWKSLESDVQEALANVSLKSYLQKIFGTLDGTLVFYPNPLVPRLISAAASNEEEIFCIIRLPEKAVSESAKTSEGEPIGSYSENSVWTKISAFHEFNHYLLEQAFIKDKDYVEKAKEIAVEKPVLEQYRVSYHEWENMFAEFITFGFTYLFLEENEGSRVADTYLERVEKKTGLTILTSLIDGLREYLEKHSTGEFIKITTYLPEFLKRF